MCLELYLKLINFVLVFTVKEDKPKLVSSDWIDHAERFTLKHYSAITAPEMLWRYGLGPRPSNIEAGILTVDNLELVRPFQVEKEKGSAPVVPTKTTGKGSKAQPIPEEREEEDTEALKRRTSHSASSRSAVSSTEAAPLEIVPMRQAPYIPPSLSKFSLTFKFLFCLGALSLYFHILTCVLSIPDRPLLVNLDKL